jgi:multidrug efflux system outer membrane protein
VSGDLKEEVPVPPLEEQLVRRWLPDGETAKDERSRSESERLLPALPIRPDQRNSLCLFEPIPRYDELAVRLSQDVTGSCQTSSFGAYLPHGSPLWKAIQCSQTAKRAIPLIEQQIVVQENTINFLLGRNPGAVPRGQTLQQQRLPSLVPAGLPSSLLERRPDIRLAEQQLIAANAQIGVAKAALFPVISLTASGGSLSNALQDPFASGTGFWSLGGSLAQPVFAGGRLRANYRLSKLEKEQLLLQYSKACQQAFREVADALIGVEKTREARIQQEALTNTLADQRQLSAARYQGGVTAFLEVLDTQRQYFSAQQSLSQAQRDELLAVIALYKALGGGWQQ